MIQKNFKLLLFSLMFLIASYTFMGGDCNTNNNNDITAPTSTVAPPASFTYKVDADIEENSRVTFNWTASPDENDDDFKGYRIITVELDSNNQFNSVFQEQALNKTIKSYTISSLERGIRFKTYLLAERNNGTKSDSLETDVYAGVFYNTNGIIDSYVANGYSLSGFGWDVSTGVGTAYPYTQSNAGKIDVHVRELSGEPYFFSPGGLDEGYKLTKMKNIGSGLSAFDYTDLPEADETFLAVNLGDVYLVKTQEGYYAKIWIKSIDPPSLDQGYYTLHFDFKVQPIQGLRVL